MTTGDFAILGTREKRPASDEGVAELASSVTYVNYGIASALPFRPQCFANYRRYGLQVFLFKA